MNTTLNRRSLGIGILGLTLIASGVGILVYAGERNDQVMTIAGATAAAVGGWMVFVALLLGSVAKGYRGTWLLLILLAPGIGLLVVSLLPDTLKGSRQG